MHPQPLAHLRLSTRPLYMTPVSAGFPSPAEDYIEKNLNLHDYVVRRPSSTFFVRVQGDSMAPGIANGDLLVVDKSLTPAPMTVILAVVDGEFTVKRWRREPGRILLIPDNPAYPQITITEAERFQVWGVVTYVIHNPNE